MLLGSSGLCGNKVRRNSSGNVDNLSFRDVAHLVFVDGKRIIEDRSPIFSGQNTLVTKEARRCRRHEEAEIVEQTYYRWRKE
jgi:hypothetical protein